MTFDEARIYYLTYVFAAPSLLNVPAKEVIYNVLREWEKKALSEGFLLDWYRCTYSFHPIYGHFQDIELRATVPTRPLPYTASPLPPKGLYYG